MNDMADTRARLLSYVSEEILLEDELSLSAGDDLLRSNTLDSLAVMRLVEYIHHELGQPIPAEDITVNNFASIDTICSYLAKRQNA